MYNLRIYKRSNQVVLACPEDVTEYTIRKIGVFWRLDIDYYDDTTDEILSDSMLLCAAESDDYQKDLIIQQVSQNEIIKNNAKIKLCTMFSDWVMSDFYDDFSTFCENHFDEYEESIIEVDNMIAAFLDKIDESYREKFKEEE